MGLNDELEKTRYAIRVISGTELGDVDAAVSYLEDLCHRVQNATMAERQACEGVVEDMTRECAGTLAARALLDAAAAIRRRGT